MKQYLYQQDIDYVADLALPWEKLLHKSILVTGASGLIGSFLIDVLMQKAEQLNCKIYAVGRDAPKAKKRFQAHWEKPNFVFVSYDINQPLSLENVSDVDFVLHLASNTHPVAYATDPIGTITTNIIGTKNLLDFAINCNAERFVFASSNEVYGENRGDVELFDEAYCGYINPNTLRAGYPESKRCGEALCQAYMAQKKMDVVIPRFTRTYGPTVLKTDTKAISQFIQKSIAGEDIVLKSEGNQYYSYTYVSDAVAGLLFVWLKGEGGHAYNIADERSDITLKNLAGLIAEQSGRKVVFELPDAVERAGYSTATKARLNSVKLQALGWTAKYDIAAGIYRTIEMLKQLSYH